MKLLPALLLAGAALFSITRLAAAASSPADLLDAQNVTWTTLGKDSRDSMPLGNGDIGVNAWTEQNGDLVLYISKTDAWSDDYSGVKSLPKVGRVRVSLSPNPFRPDRAIEHTLRLADGSMLLSSGEGADRVAVRLWVDANRPVVRLEVNSGRPISLVAKLEHYRSEPEGKLSADVVLPAKDNRVTWYHRNPETPEIDRMLHGRTFGAALAGPGLIPEGDKTLRSPRPATRHTLSIHPLTLPRATPEEWTSALTEQIRVTDQTPLEQAFSEHRAWWTAFWNRSHIFVSGAPDAATVTRGSVLQRYVTACGGRGAFPIKFNGSIFTVDNPAFTGRDKAGKPIGPVNADYRKWGGAYWFQNTRLMYWPRLAAGDFDLMQPFFRMYREILERNAVDVKKHNGHDGAYIAEWNKYWGGLMKLTPESPGGHVSHYYTPSLELGMMTLDYYEITQDETFARETLLPIVSAGLKFFDQHFKRDAQGKLLVAPANAVETYWKVTNPTPDIAGLRAILPRMIALPDALVDPATKREWSRLLAEIPELPVGERNGTRVLLPYAGEQTAPIKNEENPELYAVFPFGLYGVGRPDLTLARDTFIRRLHPKTICWGQDGVHSASVGLPDEARKNVAGYLSNQDPTLRFPAFWADGHDYEPDQDNGGNGELTLQRMLLQTEGRRILLLPAWPEEWNASFKLHAPYQTTIEGRVEGGKILDLKVTPESRRPDVVLPADRPE